MVNVSELAAYERAVKDKVYPSGCTLVQISATRGQTIFLDVAQPVEAHYVVFEPKENVLPKFLFIAIEHAIPDFCAKYQTGLNIQADAFKFLRVHFLPKEKQAQLVAAYNKAEEIEFNELKILDALKATKKFYLRKLFTEGK